MNRKLNVLLYDREIECVHKYETAHTQLKVQICNLDKIIVT